MKLSVVIPCFNEAPGMKELHRRVAEVCRQLTGCDHEILFVDDGSTDFTWREICALAEVDPCVRGIALARNYGHQIALSAGLKAAAGDRVLILDADLQDPPELLPEMMAKMDGGADVVYGQRHSRAGETWFKVHTAAAFYRILRRLVDVDIPADTGDFRLMNRRALDALNSMPEQHRFIRGMVSWIGLIQTPLLYERAPRFAGHTKYPLKKMVRFALDAITGFSIQPLRLASYLGFGVALFGALLLIYTFVSWVSGRTVEGWTSLMVVVVILTSAQLLVLGILGEYLGRLYIESKHRPLFIIRSVTGGAVMRSPPDPVYAPGFVAKDVEAATQPRQTV